MGAGKAGPGGSVPNSVSNGAEPRRPLPDGQEDQIGTMEGLRVDGVGQDGPSAQGLPRRMNANHMIPNHG